MSFTIRRLQPSDHDKWVRMRAELWKDVPVAELESEITDWVAGVNCDVIVAEDSEGDLCGFLEVAIRGCEVNGTIGRFGYIEGWYVVPGSRRQGVGGALVAAAEVWSMASGCDEILSDARVENHGSHAAHCAIGFHEVERLIHFRKRLS